jgi:hypothetical protein
MVRRDGSVIETDRVGRISADGQKLGEEEVRLPEGAAKGCKLGLHVMALAADLR